MRTVFLYLYIVFYMIYTFYLKFKFKAIDKPVDVKLLSTNQKKNLPLMVKLIIEKNLDKK